MAVSTQPAIEPLRVLVQMADEELVTECRLALESAGFHVDVRLAPGGEGLAPAAEATDANVVVVGCRNGEGGWSEGVAAVRHQRRSTIIVLVLAGEALADSVIRCLRRGATEVVLRNEVPHIGDVVLAAWRRHEEEAGREATRKLNSRFRELLEAAPDGIIEADAEGRILITNAVAAKMFGYDREEMLGITVESLVPSEARSRHDEHRRKYLGRPTVRPMGTGLELLAQRRDGSRFPVEISLSPIEAADGTHVLAVVRDVTERKLSEEKMRSLQQQYTADLAETNRQLEMRNQEVERANQLKTEFLASMSHELRTPLHTIIGFSELLLEELEGPINDKQKRFLGHIQQDSKHLLELINDILDLSKIEAGKLELRPEIFDAAEAVAEVVESVRHLSGNKRQRLDNLVEPGLPLRADRVRFKEILYNLLSNAVKFTPEAGRIWVQASEQEDFLQLVVGDTGIGIAAQDRESIFENFRQVGSTTKGVREGTGLGLAITRRLSEMHGGRIWVESEVGRGSRFHVLLPLPQRFAAAGHGPERAHLPVRQKPLVLIIEHEAGARELLVSYLEPHGYETILAADGEEGIRIARQRRPDAITVDLLLPSRAGWKLLEELHQDPETATIPVVVVSVLDEGEAAVGIGATEYLVKPVAKDTFLSAIKRHVQPRMAGAGRVLLVDDDRQSLQLLRDTLEPVGYRCLLAENGLDALEVLPHARVSAIVLDLMMPGMSGFELLFRIRGNEQWSQIPVLVLTGKDLSADDQALLKREAKAVFVKGAAWRQQLLDQLRSAVRMSEVKG